jgi:hypothetical protein
MVPDSYTTLPNGITATGEIVGTFCKPGCSTSYNFALLHGSFKQVKIPLQIGSVSGITGVNPQGTALIGFYDNGTAGGFVYENNTMTELVYPGVQATGTSGINKGGQVVGNTYNPIYGFLWTRTADAAEK